MYTDDTIERVYIPITSEITKDNPINQIVFLANNKKEPSENKNLIEKRLKDMGLETYQYTLYNDLDIKDRINNILYIPTYIPREYIPSKNILDYRNYINQYLKKTLKEIIENVIISHHFIIIIYVQLLFLI